MQTKRKAMPLRMSATHYERPKLKGRGKSRHPLGRRDRTGTLFSAGDIVKETGIYEVVHDRSHRMAHEVVMLNGNSFPPCDTCAERVRFRLVRTAPYIFQDEDFEEPS